MNPIALFSVQVLLLVFPGYSQQILTTVNSQLEGAPQMIDAEKAISAYSSFLDRPTTENAKSFADLLPEHRPDSNRRMKQDIMLILDYVINKADNYFLLDKEANAGDMNAIEAIFRLSILSDGAYSEVLLSTLGNIIRNHPGKFLYCLAKYAEPDSTDEQLGMFATMMDSYYVDRLQASRHEIRMRIRALESISDERYARVKQACIRRLNKTLEFLVD